ncbi:MAG: UvrD-helicase domain-containing protein [Bacteroidetes bacterium]|nr:UvrD-helicase domain-containing protein [Bacteroidota bacterium]
MFRVLHSSAGAGKTHALVKHYLLLALRDPDPAAYARILALTFTNKAAGEMRERILDYLEGLAAEEAPTGALADVRDTVTAAAGISAEELRQRARRTLTHMLHHWPQLAVSTIDAFTRRVVMPFARDLRLEQDLRMTTEEEHYRSKAVDLLLEEAGTDPALTQLLVATCEQLLEEERSWRPDRPLLELSKQLGREDALAHLEALRALDSAYFLALRDRLRTRVDAFRTRLQELGREGWRAIQEAGLTEKDLAYGKAGPFGYVRNLAEFDTWQKENKNVLRVLENDKWASGTATGGTRLAVEHVAPTLRHVIGTVEGLRGQEMREHAIAAAILRELMPTATLNALDRCLERAKAEEGIAFFSDLTRKVAAVVQEEPASFLYERLGEKYRHFLIDEFQDTSMLQWHALLPLLENALAGEGSALLVGDAKQAIYRWRNGEVRQFIQLPELFAKERLTQGEQREQMLVRAFVPTDPLAHNHRSAHGIIAFNNTLIAALKAELDEEDRAVYHRHEQEAVRANEGYVEIACYDDTAEEEAAPAPRFAERAIAEALADGFRPGDIAVLVRTKEQGRTIATQLAATGHEVVSPDGLSLGDDVAVRTVIALLAWSLDPNDVNAAQAAQLMALLQAGAPEVDPFAGARPPQELLRSWSARHPLVTRRLPLLSLLCRIIAALDRDPATDAFLLGLLNEAHGHAKEHGNDGAGFLEHWERTARRRSVGGAPGTTAVRILTIHASKGLQFPVVVVPFVGRSARGGAGDLLWIDPGPGLQGPPSALVRMKEPLTTFGIPEIDEEQRLRALDDLDVLYVAFTRPEQRLYAGVDGQSSDRFAKALRAHLGLEPGGSRTFGTRAPALIKPERTGDTFTLAPATPDPHRTLAIRREAPTEWDPADPDPFRAYGSALHAVLARVRTPADLAAAIEAEGNIQGWAAEERTAIRERLDTLLARPELAPFFGEGLTVHTETTLIDASGHALRPDRIVREGEQVRVLDIKTGAPSDRHQAQVRGYADLLRQVEGTAVEAYLLYLNEGALVPVDA